MKIRRFETKDSKSGTLNVQFSENLLRKLADFNVAGKLHNKQCTQKI